MTHREGVARSRDIAARWCVLAEQRLGHLTEMFETGRWRRYHSELAFLENIQEAKRAVATWRALAAGENAPAPGVIVTMSLGMSPAASSDTQPRDHVQTVQPMAICLAAETSVPIERDGIEDDLVTITAAPIVPAAEPEPEPREQIIEFTLNLDGIEARYPLLRNAF